MEEDLSNRVAAAGNNWSKARFGVSGVVEVSSSSKLPLPARDKLVPIAEQETPNAVPSLDDDRSDETDADWNDRKGDGSDLIATKDTDEILPVPEQIGLDAASYSPSDCHAWRQSSEEAAQEQEQEPSRNYEPHEAQLMDQEQRQDSAESPDALRYSSEMSDVTFSAAEKNPPQPPGQLVNQSSTALDSNIQVSSISGSQSTVQQRIAWLKNTFDLDKEPVVPRVLKRPSPSAHAPKQIRFSSGSIATSQSSKATAEVENASLHVGTVKSRIAWLSETFDLNEQPEKQRKIPEPVGATPAVDPKFQLQELRANLKPTAVAVGQAKSGASHPVDACVSGSADENGEETDQCVETGSIALVLENETTGARLTVGDISSPAVHSDIGQMQYALQENSCGADDGLEPSSEMMLDSSVDKADQTAAGPAADIDDAHKPSEVGARLERPSSDSDRTVPKFGQEAPLQADAQDSDTNEPPLSEYSTATTDKNNESLGEALDSAGHFDVESAVNVSAYAQNRGNMAVQPLSGLDEASFDGNAYERQPVEDADVDADEAGPGDLGSTQSFSRLVSFESEHQSVDDNEAGQAASAQGDALEVTHSLNGTSSADASEHLCQDVIEFGQAADANAELMDDTPFHACDFNQYAFENPSGEVEGSADVPPFDIDIDDSENTGSDSEPRERCSFEAGESVREEPFDEPDVTYASSYVSSDLARPQAVDSVTAEPEECRAKPAEDESCMKTTACSACPYDLDIDVSEDESDDKAPILSNNFQQTNMSRPEDEPIEAADAASEPPSSSHASTGSDSEDGDLPHYSALDLSIDETEAEDGDEATVSPSFEADIDETSETAEASDGLLSEDETSVNPLSEMVALVGGDDSEAQDEGELTSARSSMDTGGNIVTPQSGNVELRLLDEIAVEVSSTDVTDIDCASEDLVMTARGVTPHLINPTSDSSWFGGDNLETAAPSAAEASESTETDFTAVDCTGNWLPLVVPPGWIDTRGKKNGRIPSWFGWAGASVASGPEAPGRKSSQDTTTKQTSLESELFLSFSHPDQLLLLLIPSTKRDRKVAVASWFG